MRETRTVAGKPKEIEHGPAASAEAMTRQFNALAEEGWEYVGPVGTTGGKSVGALGNGELSLFKRAKR
jgi:hypothetical protein